MTACFRCRFEVAGNQHGVQCTTPLSFTIGDNRETPAFFYRTNSHIFNPVIAIIRILTHVKVRFYLVHLVTVKLFFVIEDCILRSPPSRSTAEPLQTHTRSRHVRAHTHCHSTAQNAFLSLFKSALFNFAFPVFSVRPRSRARCRDTSRERIESDVPGSSFLALK